MSHLSPKQLQEFLDSTQNWSLRGHQLACTFTFDSFLHAIDFVNATATIAEEQQHHPDIDIRFRDVSLFLTTHDEGGLTLKDLRLAKDLESLAARVRQFHFYRL